MKEFIKNNKEILIAVVLLCLIVVSIIMTISLVNIDNNIDDIEYNTRDVGTELDSIHSKLDHLDYLKYLDPDKDMKDAMWQKALRESKQ